MFNQKDKLQHMLVGIVISQIIAILCVLFLPIWTSLLISLAISTTVMYGKELVWDKWMKKGTYNIKDFYAGLIGIGYGVLTSLFYFLV